MPTLAELPPDAITMGLLEAGRNDDLADGWVHEKLAPATIIAMLQTAETVEPTASAAE